MFREATIAASLLLLSGGLAKAQDDWFPARAREGVALEMASRLEKIDVAQPVDKTALLETARVSVRALGERLETWGEDGVLERVPDLSGLELPRAEKPLLDAMATYGACTHFLDAIYSDESGDQPAQFRIVGAMGSVALTVTTSYLRHLYLATGGADDEIRFFLGTEAMTSVAGRVRGSQTLLDYTMKQCQPAVSALLE